MNVTRTNRVTLIVRPNADPAWTDTGLVILNSLRALRIAVAAHDVERIIVDRAATAEQFLFLLTALPHEIAGDVLLVREDGGAFLSAIGRGGDRVLYNLSPRDVGFYFRVHGLVERELALTA